MSAGLGVSEIGMHRVQIIKWLKTEKMSEKCTKTMKLNVMADTNLNIYVLFTKFVV